VEVLREMVRVGVLTSVHPAWDVRIFHKECKALVRAGYDVTLVVPHERDEVAEGIRIKAVPKPTGRLVRMTCTTWQVYRKAVELDADVYHFHDPELIPVGLLLRARGKRVVYDVHEDVPRSILSKYYLPRWSRSLLARVAEGIEGLTSRAFSALVAATPAIADRHVGRNGNCVVVQNFPLVDEFSSAANEPWSHRAPAVAYVGGISPERGIRQMVEAMGLLPDRLEATLKLAGEFDPPWIRDELVGLPGWNRVEEVGFLDRLRVAEVLGTVQVGLVLFHPYPNHISAQPNKLFEYMSAGIPVIASDFPLWRQIVQGTGCGLLVDPLDPKAIAEAIEYVLTHPEEAEAMGRRGREAVEQHYNWETEERKLLDLYDTLLCKDRTPR
jgi:glycosyltransferase involved in cell wall biosynthesis